MISDIYRYPINVIAAFNPDGEIKPLYFQIIENEEKVCVKIIDHQEITEGVNHSAHCVFKCKYEHYGTFQTATILFYMRNHTWYLQK